MCLHAERLGISAGEVLRLHRVRELGKADDVGKEDRKAPARVLVNGFVVAVEDLLRDLYRRLPADEVGGPSKLLGGLRESLLAVAPGLHDADDQPALEEEDGERGDADENEP